MNVIEKTENKKTATKQEENKMEKNEIMKELENVKARSAWENGVVTYAMELLEELESEEITKENLLNGAENWDQYSWDGSSLIYDCDIAERLCTPSELKRKKGGELSPSSREEWLGVQARALNQACNKIMRLAKM